LGKRIGSIPVFHYCETRNAGNTFHGTQRSGYEFENIFHLGCLGYYFNNMLCVYVLLIFRKIRPVNFIHHKGGHYFVGFFLSSFLDGTAQYEPGELVVYRDTISACLDRNGGCQLFDECMLQKNECVTLETRTKVYFKTIFYNQLKGWMIPAYALPHYRRN
jgi:hypothetical protein